MFQFELLQTTRIARIKDRTGQDFLDPTGTFQNLRRLTGFCPARSTGFYRRFLFTVQCI